VAPDYVGLLVEFKINEANLTEVMTMISLGAKLKAKKKRPERRVSALTWQSLRASSSQSSG